MLSYTNFGDMVKVFEWFRSNLPKGTYIDVINVSEDEATNLKRLRAKGLVDTFHME